jgi:hypothetical protein
LVVEVVSTPEPIDEPLEFTISLDAFETRRGRRVSVEFMDAYRAVLDELTPSAQMKLAAVAMAYATDMAEMSAIAAVERIQWCRKEFGWKDPDVLRALQPAPRVSTDA